MHEKLNSSWHGNYQSRAPLTIFTDCVLRKMVNSKTNLKVSLNESILYDRQKLLNLKLNNMSQKAGQWLTQMMSTYKVTEDKESFTDDQLKDMINSTTHKIGKPFGF